MELLATKKVWRFVFGGISGIFFAGILWSFTIFFHTDITLTQGIIGSIVTVLTFGLISAYGDLDRFLNLSRQYYNFGDRVKNKRN